MLAVEDDYVLTKVAAIALGGPDQIAWTRARMAAAMASEWLFAFCHLTMQIDRSREGLWKWYLGLFIGLHQRPYQRQEDDLYSNMGNRNRHLHS